MNLRVPILCCCCTFGNFWGISRRVSLHGVRSPGSTPLVLRCSPPKNSTTPLPLYLFCKCRTGFIRTNQSQTAFAKHAGWRVPVPLLHCWSPRACDNSIYALCLARHIQLKNSGLLNKAYRTNGHDAYIVDFLALSTTTMLSNLAPKTKNNGLACVVKKQKPKTLPCAFQGWSCAGTL